MSKPERKEKKEKKHHKEKSSKSKSSSSSSASGENSFDLSEISRSINAQIAEVAGVVAPEQDEPQEPEDKLPVTEESVVKGNFYVYSKKCLNCVHLCPTIGKKAYSDCHYSKGNDSCPAQEIKVVVMLPYETISNRLFDAHIKGDAATMASLMARLNRQDQDEVDKVLARYAKLLAEHNS